MAGCGCAGAPERVVRQSAGAKQWVVLIHGLGRSALAMKPLEWFLQRAGYGVVNVSFPTRRCTVEQLAERHLQEAISSRIPPGATRIDFVTHSLGGIVLRQYLSKRRVAKLGRVVMLAPPNHGSELVDKLQGSLLGRWILGASGRDLGTRPMDLPRRLPALSFETGVIAGDRSVNPAFRRILGWPNDGTVSVASARIEGMKDFAVVHSSHTLLLWRPKTFGLVLAFLRRGRFEAEKGVDGQLNAI